MFNETVSATCRRSRSGPIQQLHLWRRSFFFRFRSGLQVCIVLIGRSSASGWHLKNTEHHGRVPILFQCCENCRVVINTPLGLPSQNFTWSRKAPGLQGRIPHAFSGLQAGIAWCLGLAGHKLGFRMSCWTLGDRDAPPLYSSNACLKARQTSITGARNCHRHQHEHPKNEHPSIVCIRTKAQKSLAPADTDQSSAHMAATFRVPSAHKYPIYRKSLYTLAHSTHHQLIRTPSSPGTQK